MTLLGKYTLSKEQLVNVSPRLLAHLGDAVFHLFERERIIVDAASAFQMHVTARVSAQMQAQLLEAIRPQLNDSELEIVRRARNMKASGYRRGDQTSYRQATAFEALLGYLYLSNFQRLQELLDCTTSVLPPQSAPDETAAGPGPDSPEKP